MASKGRSENSRVTPRHLRFYYADEIICKNGHVDTPRYVANGRCVACERESARKKRKRVLTPEQAARDKQVKRESKWRRRGASPPTRPEPSNCECCGGLPGKKSMSLDHNHLTGAFRGWLCSNCNTAIGKLGDSIAGVKRALEYLERCESH